MMAMQPPAAASLTVLLENELPVGILMRRITLTVLGCLALLGPGGVASAQDEPTQPVPFEAGFGKRDITPQGEMPMWGYGARHAMLSQGALDPLYAKAVVLRAGEDKVALVGLDLGRGPTQLMMERIRSDIAARAGIENVMISGSHTHHGPVIELTDRKGFGKGKYDDAVAYAEALPGMIVEAILEADEALQRARIGVATTDLNLNRNRHTKRQPKPTDPMLAAIRIDDEQGSPIAVLVNFAAHPVMTSTKLLKFSADYPGFLEKKVEADLQTNCVFMQGASGDMSTNPGENIKGPQQYGEALAGHVLELARSIDTTTPEKPSVAGVVDRFRFGSRTNFSDPFVVAAYSVAFFPALIRNFVAEMQDGVQAELNTVLLNGEIALVGGSGEFFCNHSVRLKQRSYLKHTLFFGYCNGHNLYYPTIEAVSEGGYGADASVSPVEVGAGERMMDRALINIYTLTGKIEAAKK